MNTKTLVKLRTFLSTKENKLTVIKKKTATKKIKLAEKITLHT